MKISVLGSIEDGFYAAWKGKQSAVAGKVKSLNDESISIGGEQT